MSSVESHFFPRVWGLETGPSMGRENSLINWDGMGKGISGKRHIWKKAYMVKGIYGKRHI